MTHFLNSLKCSFDRQKQILLHARQMFSGAEITAFDAIVIVVLLMLLTAAQKLLFAVQMHTSIAVLDVLQPMFLAVLLGWGGLSSLTYYVGRWTKHGPDFTHIVILMGAAGLPLLLATLASVLVILACLILGVTGGQPTWQLVHTVIGAIGLVFGWPGYFTALALQAGARIKRAGALLISLALILVLVAGFVLPYLIQ